MPTIFTYTDIYILPLKRSKKKKYGDNAKSFEIMFTLEIIVFGSPEIKKKKVYVIKKKIT